MGNKTDILKKAAMITLWSSVGVISFVLLIASRIQHSEDVCKDVVVRIKSAENSNYISQKEILNRLSDNHPELLKNKSISSFNLSQLEALLEHHLWIRNAELFFDIKNVLHVEVEERTPVARIFCADGESFYVDELGIQLPANGNQVANVPVFTGFPHLTKPLLSNDSLLLMQVRDMGAYILKHEFWIAQIEQIQIDKNNMELIPKLGKHQILFGEGVQIEQKFKRLMLFYKNVLHKAGWNYYSLLDLRYDKQIVGVRRDSISLYKSFVIPFDTIEINKVLDTAKIDQDTLRKDKQVKQSTQVKKAIMTNDEELQVLGEAENSIQAINYKSN
jgi:cell division protein FtsQ